jgi:multicomponent Na+:H+ antiporter subunit G
MHNTIRDIGYVLITTGVIYNLIAAAAVVRFSNASTRLIVSTKAIAFGTLLVIIGAVAVCGWSAIGLKALVCLVFAIVTTPVEAHALLRAWHKVNGDKADTKEY